MMNMNILAVVTPPYIYHYRRYAFSSGTFIRRGCPIFMSCDFLTLMCTLTPRGPLIIVYRCQRKKKIGSIWCSYSINDFIFHCFCLVGNPLGTEDNATLKRIACSLILNWNQPYYQMCKYFKSVVLITTVWSTHIYT